MTNKSKRRRFLELQKRVAEARRRETLQALAEAQASEKRARNLADRTSAMASDYSRGCEAVSALEFRNRGRFAASLAAIAGNARAAIKRSEEERQMAGAQLASRDQQLERIEEHLRSEKREADRKAQLRETTQSAALARKLLNHPRNQSH